MIPHGDIDLGQHWLRYWLVVWWHQAITWTNIDENLWYSPVSNSPAQWMTKRLFSAANLALAGFPLTNALGESMPSRHLNMFNLRLYDAATIQYSQLKFGHMHHCGMDYKYFSPHCCKCDSFGCIAAIRCGNACHGPHSDSLYSGSEHSQFNSPRLVKREAGFPNPRRALIGSNQLWRVNDSPYYRKFCVMSWIVPSSLLYKVHQIPKLKSLLSRLAAVFAQSLEARC